ncbi:hypothetical protein GOB87_13525 [Acetobacter estunensis]|uniref:Integrase n=2 Tax=Acetobacter estunensis TaxID=104097 RepID=A0A967EI71_9PROT|nr:hypothetical protein [Acetobacter estunensis]
MPTPYMLRRHHTWYLRLRVPADLRHIAGQYVVRSLKTGDRSLAQARAIGLASSFNGLWMDFRKKLAEQLKAYFDGESPKGEMVSFVREHKAEIEALPEDAKAAFSTWMDMVITRTISERDDLKEERDQTYALTDMWKTARHQGVVEGMERAMSLLGNTLPRDVPPPPGKAAGTSECEEPWPTLVTRFHEDNPGQSEKTMESYGITFRQFADLIGDKPLNTITKQDMKSYADWLKDKPSKRGGTLGRNTIIRHLGEVNFFLKWCVQSGLIEDWGFADVQARARTQEEKKTRQEDRRRAFTETELTQIFNSPLFTGYKSDARRSVPGSCLTRITDFWFISVLAMSGARIGELTEAPAELYDLEGIPCFDLRQAGTKTQNSPRLVPVLPQLKSLGFLNYVDRQKRAGRMLMEPLQGAITAEGWSKRINRYLQDIGLTDKNLVAYSFRHSFRQMLRVSDLNMEIINKIFGHETGSVGAGYGANLSRAEAQQFIDRVKFPVFLGELVDTHGSFL